MVLFSPAVFRKQPGQKAIPGNFTIPRNKQSAWLRNYCEPRKTHFGLKLNILHQNKQDLRQDLEAVTTNNHTIVTCIFPQTSLLLHSVHLGILAQLKFLQISWHEVALVPTTCVNHPTGHPPHAQLLEFIYSIISCSIFTNF